MTQRDDPGRDAIRAVTRPELMTREYLSRLGIEELFDELDGDPERIAKAIVDRGLVRVSLPSRLEHTKDRKVLPES